MDKQKGDKNILDSICLIITTCAGIGYVPLFSGTAAALAALFLFLIIHSQIVFIVLTIVVAILAFSLSGRAEVIFQEKDSKRIVIDDFLGMMIALLFVPRHPGLVLVSFFLFRAFDVLKVYPANRLEKLPGARGVVGDDVVAGIYANVGVHVLRFIFRGSLYL